MAGNSVPLTDERTVTIQARYGKMTFWAWDSVIGRSLQVYGEWAQNEIALMSLFLEEGAVAVDAGANIGTHALAFAHHVGSSGRVFAFEPQPDLFELLCRNLQDNSAERVDARCAALSDRHEILYVPHLGLTGGRNSGATQLLQNPPQDQETVPVEAAPLDDLQLDRCDLIKVDVEGMEVRVLDGAESTLRRCMPVLYLECNTNDHALGIFEHLHDKPYRLYLHKAPAFNPANFFDSKDKIFGSAYETSILAIPLHRYPEFAPRLASNSLIVPIGSVEDVTAAMAEAQVIVDLRQALANAERLAFEGQAELRRYDEALAEAQRLAFEGQAEVRRYGEAVAEAQQLVVQRDEEIARLRPALAHAEGLATSSQVELRRYDEALAEAQRLVTQRDQEIAQLRPALAEAERLVVKEQTELRRYDEALAEAQRLAFEGQAEIGRYREALAEAQRIVVQRDQEIAQLRPALLEAEMLASKRNDELQAMRDSAIRLENERLILEERLGAIQSSLAWRMISPFWKFPASPGRHRS